MRHAATVTPETKSDVRKAIRARRRTRVALPDEGIRIADLVMSLDEVQQACTRNAAVTCFASRPEEPDTAPLRAVLREAGATVLLPVVSGDSLLWAVDDPLTSRVNAMNIQEPTGPPADEVPAVWIVPALAVDRAGWRLGQGGGYYDRALTSPRLTPAALVAAIIFDEELLPVVPHDNHDQRVDAVVTPSDVHRLTAR